MPKFTKNEKNGSRIELTVSNRTIIRVAVILIVIYIAFIGVEAASHAILLIFISFFLALALNAPVQFISKHMPGKLKGSRGFGTSISYLIVIAILGGFIAYLIPPMVHQTQNFIASSPRIINEFRNQSGAVGGFIRRYHLQNEVGNLSSQLSSRIHGIGGKAFSTVFGIGKSIFSVITVLVLTFMMLVEGPRWVNTFKRMVPSHRHEVVERLSTDMYKVIKGYVNGQVLLALIATVLILPALYIFHISYPVALIAVIFICALIPLVGHSIGAIIVTIVAAFHSTTSAIGVLIYYILYIQVENYLIQPKLQANNTNMSPLLVFASLVIGLDLAGLLGGLIAIPLAGCIRIAFLELLRSRNIITTTQFDKVTTKKSSNSTEGH